MIRTIQNMLKKLSVLIIVVTLTNFLDFHVFFLKDRTVLILTMRNMLELMAYVTSLPQTKKKTNLEWISHSQVQYSIKVKSNII